MNIKLRIKLKEIKDGLIKSWYRSMTPTANAIIKYEEYSFKKREKEVKQWADEYAIKRCAKSVLSKLINSRSIYATLFFEIGECCSYFDLINGQTIRDFAINQRKDKKLKLWGYKLPRYDVNRLEELTDLLKKELEKNSMIFCEYVKYDYIESGYDIENYKKTLIVKLKDN